MQYANFCNAFLIVHKGEEAIINSKYIINAGEKLPDIILLDLNMPIKDGWQFLDELIKNKTHKNITIYVITSSIDLTDIERSKEYNNVNNYLLKPKTIEILKAYDSRRGISNFKILHKLKSLLISKEAFIISIKA